MGQLAPPNATGTFTTISPSGEGQANAWIDAPERHTSLPCSSVSAHTPETNGAANDVPIQ